MARRDPEFLSLVVLEPISWAEMFFSGEHQKNTFQGALV